MSAFYNESFNITRPREDIHNNLNDYFNNKGYKMMINNGDPNTIKAKTKTSFWSWGEIIEVKFLSNDIVSISSRCRLATQIIDWGKNRKNVLNIMNHIS